METTTTAEFRTIKKKDIEGLIESSRYERIDRGGFLGFFKKVEYVDNYENYLAEKTRLIGKFSGKGFLLFDDIVIFLKSFKAINLLQPEFQSIDYNSIHEREENAYFLDSNYVRLLSDQISKISIEDSELEEFNQASSFGLPMNELIVFQKDQIRQLSLLFNQFKDEVLYIRCEASNLY
ncbi:hypothetical protein LX69_00561 [Breznakibacter xylanolyticus]|uniref:Uncharacterized protein n=1 Tax=Breznakibacter xylanolyticus TaxID=990 RepID=A0A2W7NIP0_9BACT|nr:hypothetical protein [Breznakibacter xylanolyticus]PZX20108.1 hypothetical protein LX69_00561 [Breznakibacter xylanolyticus]